MRVKTRLLKHKLSNPITLCSLCSCSFSSSSSAPTPSSSLTLLWPQDPASLTSWGAAGGPQRRRDVHSLVVEIFRLTNRTDRRSGEK